MHRITILHILIFIFAADTADAQSEQRSAAFYAGFRASRILSSYPNNQFPSAEYWIKTANGIAGKFPGATPSGIWIVSLYQNNGITRLGFPSGGAVIPNVTFSATDNNEAHLSAFDTSGVKVWLQVEPGAADMDTLISLVLNRYKHHPSVIGFGIDVEWFYTNTNTGGRKLTDSMAARWDQKVRSIDSSYTLFIKHYGQSWMPPTYRGSVLFVDDSQDFTFSGNPFNAMVSEFKSWGAKFSPANSAFQFGYKADSVWWRTMADPMKTIGDALRSNIPTCAGVFWVDFTITKIFPITSFRPEAQFPLTTELNVNYPNPFNSTTTISYQLSAKSLTMLKIFDIVGREVATLVNESQDPGTYSIQWNAAAQVSGIYVVLLQSGGTMQAKKIVLMK